MRYSTNTAILQCKRKANNMQNANANAIKQHVLQSDEGYALHRNLQARDLRVAGAQVLSVSMHVAATQENGYYMDGDLAVNWSMEGLQNDEAAQTMGALLLRNIHSEDEVTAVMGAFYWKGAFTKQLHSILREAGFSSDAAEDVSTSEWGMQDEERASYDAGLVAQEVRAAMAS